MVHNPGGRALEDAAPVVAGAGRRPTASGNVFTNCGAVEPVMRAFHISEVGAARPTTLYNTLEQSCNKAGDTGTRPGQSLVTVTNTRWRRQAGINQAAAALMINR